MTGYDTKIKLCGLSRPCDIEAANACRPDYIGFVFAPDSRRYVTPEQAARLKELLAPGILAVGVFVREDPAQIADLLQAGIIHMTQLHGSEDEAYIRRLRALTDRPILQAFRIRTSQDLAAAQASTADGVLLDSGAGGGTLLDWNLARHMKRPYYLAGGLTPENVARAVKTLHPYGVDVSSGIETKGHKDSRKMEAFVSALRSQSFLR